MKNKIGLFASTSVVAALVSAIVISTWDRESAKAVDSDADDSVLVKQLATSAQNIAQLTQAVTQLENKLLRIEKAQRAVTQQPVSVIQQQTVATVDDRSSMIPIESSDDLSLSEPEPDLKGYQQQFTPESFDVDWSLATEAAALTALYDYEIVDIELESVECYQSACQLEFQHLTDEADESLIERLQANEAFAGEFFAQTLIDENGVKRTVLVVGEADEIITDES